MNNFVAASVFSVALIFLSIVFAGIWVYKDAKQRGLQAGLWTLLVVLSGNFIGLILYLLIGRKQTISVCGNCSSKINIQGAFCPACGEKIEIPAVSVKTNKTLLISCIVCILLSFSLFGLSIYFSLNSNGFTVNNKYSLYSYSSNGYAKKLSQSSSGNIWSLSFEEVSDNYVVKNTYNAGSKPLSLTVEVTQSTGSVALLVTQGDKSINETIGEGSFKFDMSGFETGKISISITNIDAYNFSGRIVVETDR